jgi:hypothetical protein
VDGGFHGEARAASLGGDARGSAGVAVTAAEKRVRLRAAERALDAAVMALKVANCSETLLRMTHVVLRDVAAQIEAGSVDDEPTVLEERLRASLRVCRPGGAA